MGPIEVLWGSLIIFFAIIGYIRGFPKELGVTTMVLLAMFVLVRFGDLLTRWADRALRLIGMGFIGTPNEDLFKFNIYLLFLLFIVYISYEGETLAFAGTAPRGLPGRLLSLGAGFFNGYLIVGTIWYYLDVFNYPAQKWGLFKPPLTPFAESLLPWLPLNVLPEGRQELYLLALIIILLILRVIR